LLAELEKQSKTCPALGTSTAQLQGLAIQGNRRKLHAIEQLSFYKGHTYINYSHVSTSVRDIHKYN
jgi:hypothetical protein